MRSKPAARASATASATRPGVWTRSSSASTCCWADCMPNEIRFTPASRAPSSQAFVALSGVASLVLSVAAAGGCGGNTKAKNDYVAAVNRAQSDFVAVVDDSESRISGNASDAETATQLEMIRTAAAKVVVELRSVKPPGNVR